MRDYGVVRVRFWEWAKRKGLSLQGRELALYLLTSPHGNSLGCFRLPMAYLCEDLGKGIETVSEAVSELYRIGFLERDEGTGWTWIIGYLDHNPIPNRNVGKAIEKMIDSVPMDLPFFGTMIEALRSFVHPEEKGLTGSYLDRVLERYRNRFDTPSRESKTHTQTHEHTHDHEGSEAKASGGKPPDAVKSIFDEGVALLVSKGTSPKQARSLVGQWRSKAKDDDRVAALIREAARRNITEPIPWFVKALEAPSTDPWAGVDI